MPKKIVFIEDEPALQKSLGSFLRQEGYDVDSALDGETGLKLAKTQNPDLILLDIILPKMDGFEVLEALKSDEKTKNIPVIVLTNLERMKDVEQALVTGATSYLIKTDYDLRELVQKVKQAIKQK